MIMSLSPKFKSTVKGRYEKYQFEVGTFTNAAHRNAKSGSKRSFLGGPARQVSGKSSGDTIKQVSKKLQAYLGFNYLVKPFLVKTRELDKFMNEFFLLITGVSSVRKVEKLLLNVVRKPILLRKYGPNTESAREAKGFDRLMIDTGQVVRSIQAKIKRRRGGASGV